MDGIKFEFNDIISLYTKNDSERKRYVSVDILYHKYYIDFILLLLINNSEASKLN